MKTLSTLVCLFLLALPVQSIAQSNPKIDRPVQKCIDTQSDAIELLPKNFSIGHWLGRVIQNSAKIQASSGTGGGPAVVALLKMEPELDELIALSEQCDFLGDEKVKASLQEMKAIFQEKKEVETYKKNPQSNSTNLFGEEDELETMSIPRSAAKKLKSSAEKVKKLLKSK